MTPASSSPIPPDDLLAHAGFVRGLARALVSGDADVDDVVQETWLAALASTGSRIRRPRSWLASVVRRRAARHHRIRASLDKRHAEGTRPVEVPTPEDLTARHEIIQRVSTAVAALPPPYRDALVLRYYEELPPREVARKLEIPVETARTRIRRGLVRLREILDEKHDGRRAAWAMPLAGLVSSGSATVGIGALAIGGIAAAALLVLGFAVVPWPWSKGTPPPVKKAQHVPDEVPSPTLMGRGGPGSDTADVTDSTLPSDTDVETPARISEESPPEDEAADKIEVLVRVVDEKGQPVEGLGIREHIRGDGGPFDIVTHPVGRTDATGRAAVLASPSAFGFGIEENDSWALERGFGGMPEPGEEVVLRAIPTLVLRGRVIDVGGAPIQGAGVRAQYRSRSERGSTSMSVQQLDPSDEDGRFTASIPAYATEVTLRAFGGGAFVEARVDLREQREIVLRVTSPIWIRGEVVTEDGRPIDQTLHGKPEIRLRPLAVHDRIQVTSPEDGSKAFGLRVSEPGRYHLSVSWTPRNTTTLGTPAPMIVEAPIDGIRFVCPRGSKLAGRLPGDDVGGFWVMWARNTSDGPLLQVRHRTRTDADGRFALHGLVEGDTVLYIHRSGEERYGLLERARLPAEDLIIELQRGLTLRGRVRDYEGRHGFGLWLYFTWRGPTIPVEVGDDGTFTVTGLPPGTYGVRWHRAGKEGDLELEVEAGSQEVEVVVPEEILRMGQTPER